MVNEGDSTPPVSPKNGKKPVGSSGSGAAEGAVVQRIVREVSIGPVNWPHLTKSNYTEWALLIKIKMQARNLWDAVEPGGVSLR
jgi:hypothetical protein